ncbi:isocitrate lyase/PEP mutase family protein [Ancylobacter mangrovi]|uniref:isocitrate lyase/PEP mutase family protein n=1 Tax=Ancylobacter mangrovi TaxID=2972472 RepID=UPI002162F83F|nr:isocitrate lyase/phosphoenolpyruvate mutase family protein [Ancylobacter mangrovi]MCS0503361.1 isocitrate lyase/phosphoenolpyruvate mutase family protein [Ancylobacter mangrovi]
MNDKCRTLRDLIAQPRLIQMMGAYDALSAQLAERAGFEILHVGGYCLSAAHFAMPDVGTLTMSEVLGFVRTIAARTTRPIIADIDDGYGNHLNVTRAIEEFERAGAAGVHMEDQMLPKRCGHMQGKRLVSKEAMVTKIRAAVAARTNPDFVIVARTDAVAVSGFDDALDRGRAYEAAGADVIFVEAIETEEQAALVPKSFSVPTLFNWCIGGKTPTLPAARIEEMGFRLLMFPDILFPVVKCLQDFHAEVRREGTYLGFADRIVPFQEFNDLVGMKRVEELDRLYDPA